MAAILTKAQRDHLFAVYRTKGGAATRALAVKYGVSPSYVTKKLVQRHGVRFERRPEDGRQPRRPKHEDPRWARARAIGMVVA
jgi:hypothetical protein